MWFLAVVAGTNLNVITNLGFGKTLLVRLPSLCAVLLRLGENSLVSALDAVDTSADNDDIASRVIDDLSRRTVLLTEFVAFSDETHTGREDEEVVVDTGIDAAHGNEPNDPITTSVARHLDSGLGVISFEKVTRAAHLGKKQEGTTKRLADFAQASNDTWSREGMSVGQVAPIGNTVHTGRVLQLDGVAFCQWSVFSRLTDVSKLSVFEDDEVVLVGKLGKLGRQCGRKVLDNVNVGLLSAIILDTLSMLASEHLP